MSVEKVKANRRCTRIFLSFFNFTNYTKNTLHTNIQHINKCSKFYFLHLTTFTYTKKNKIGVESVAKKRKKNLA